ncbi:hypothetical protein FOA52_000225 [Chlamydomonas sp. UWO 241]|nr:hypothetical protein FOA52_000225 [Chlamydomonas sp. UWO 241]
MLAHTQRHAMQLAPAACRRAGTMLPRPALLAGTAGARCEHVPRARPDTARAAATTRPASSAAAAAPSEPPSLEEWLVASGGSVHGVRLVPVARQVVATQALQPGDVLVSVPRACQVRYDDLVAGQPQLSALFGQLPRGTRDGSAPSWQFRQALALLWHAARGADSPLAPYLRLLPGVARGVPTPRVGMVMGERAVAELQYQPLIDDVRNQQFWWERVASETLPQAQASPSTDPFGGVRVGKAALGWALAVTNSRTFGLSRSGAHTMPPLIDMVDHDPERANVAVMSDETGAVQLVATAAIEPGVPLALSYGAHDSRNLLLSYGFVTHPAPNDADAFTFDFDVDGVCGLAEAGPGSAAELAAWQRAALARLGLLAAGDDGGGGGGGVGDNTAVALDYRVHMCAAAAPPAAAAPSGASAAGDGGGGSTGGRQPLSPRLLAGLRVVTLADGPANATLVASMSTEELGDWDSLLGRQHEVGVMRLASRLAAALYRGMGSTLQQDAAQVSALEAQLIALGSVERTRAGEEPSSSGSSSCSSGSSSSSSDGGGSRGSLLGSLDGVAVAAAAAAAGPGAGQGAGELEQTLKRCLERALQAVVARAAQLDALVAKA